MTTYDHWKSTEPDMNAATEAPHGEPNEEELFDQLRDLTKRWNAFDLIPSAQEAECRRIGRILHKIGGEALMRTAYYDATAENRAASVIAAYWDGIGEWRW